MTYDELVEYFGSQAGVARAFNITQASVAEWKDGVPPLRQVQAEQMTAGSLKADAGVFDEPSRRAKSAV